MNSELISKLIERARAGAENAYCPYTNQPQGCSLLVGDNMIFGGCNIENGSFGCTAEAGEVALYKAISEGCTAFRAVCFWAAERMPYPSGKVLQLFAEFNPSLNLSIVVAKGEDKSNFRLHTLRELLPFPAEPGVIE